MDERLERHLCNLHNEVFEAAESRINTECSLTIREGISDAVINAFNQGEFPHYTWGYIGRTEQSAGDCEVPSLYVRVYRIMYVNHNTTASSLTIREGISPVLLSLFQKSLFPHYTWGYIDAGEKSTVCIAVPSLYVRVYRRAHEYKKATKRSLTIREGISPHM